MYFYLIKRGPKPDYHRAPYHPVIITPKRKVAKWEAGSTENRAWIWVGDAEGGWLLVRWNGFDIDYGHTVHLIRMPDGTEAKFYHNRNAEPWTLLKGAIWWDTKEIPKRLLDLGVVNAPDEWTLEHIKRTLNAVKELRL
jgi:hypothetical protein